MNQPNPAATDASTSLPDARTPAGATTADQGHHRTTTVVIPLDGHRVAGLEQWTGRRRIGVNRAVSLAVEEYLQPLTGASRLGSPRRGPTRVGRGLSVELTLDRRRRSRLLLVAHERGVRVGQIVLESLEQYLRQNSTEGPEQLPT